MSRRIIDDDFIEPMPPRIARSTAANLGYAVIRVYTDKNLPVLPNLMRALLYRNSICAFGLHNIVERNKTLNPLYGQYADEIDKLLVLV